MEQGREEDPKEPMESDSRLRKWRETPLFQRKKPPSVGRRNCPPATRTQRPPPPVSDVLGRLTTTLHQLSAVTGLSRNVELPRYDGSYEAQSFFTNYDAQADRAQLQYSTRLRKPANLLQAPLRVTHTRAPDIFRQRQQQRPIRRQYLSRSTNSQRPCDIFPPIRRQYLSRSTNSHGHVTSSYQLERRKVLVLNREPRLGSLRLDLTKLCRLPPRLHGRVDIEVRLASGVLDRLRFLPIKKMDQRTCTKFCVKNEIKCADAFRMLTVAYGEATLDQSNVYRWYKMFSEGREDVNDEERAGRPSTSTTDEKINEVEKMILANRLITIREVAEDLNISIGSCHSIFINDLGIRRVAAKFVLKLLNCDQKQHRMNIVNEMLDSVRDDLNLLQRVITGDEAWVYGYEVETKSQSSQWKLPHEPRPKKARQVRSNVKVLLGVFFDCRGVVHHEFLPQGRTVKGNITCKLYAICAKQSARNARICGRTKIVFCTTITPLLTHRCFARLFGQKQHTNDAAATVYPQIWPPVTFSCSLN
ncbi:hypothetical protein LAZ67_5004261 [Cordylochernes scorpioides]|uniref:Mos1 transposase HTH domain-containing protein n=1 Tax=Cordylochernes scorpioides TaxID=51811 RepID=A0ABY6KHU1_9ARAC|nr:hypothetical protein LAZ67_5004261 [Cordylochernes scorpioides]